MVIPLFLHIRVLIGLAAFIMAFGGLLNHLHHHGHSGDNNNINHQANAGAPPPVPTQPGSLPGQNQGFRSVLYFCNWAIYGRKHFPKDIPLDRVSHILYAFANITPETGEIVLSDKWSDTDIVLDGDSWNDPNTYLKGCLNQFFNFKKQHRSLKIMLSIGGWTYSSALAQGASTVERRKNFATSAVKLLKELGLDGLDVDWEYPQNEEQAQQYVDLLRELRLELDSYALHLNLPRDQFELSVAAPAGPFQYRTLKVRDMDQYLTFWNVMCYDYAGSWSNTAQHHANLFGGELNTDTALKYYQSGGVHPSKLVMGMPIYGRAFVGTDGLGKPYSGIGEGSWEAGTWDFKALPLPGSTETTDMQAVAAYSYDPQKKLLVTYDNNATIKAKADYVRQNGYGGGMWWESSGDMPLASGKSLVHSFTEFLGPASIDKKQNCLYYPESPHENLKNYTQQKP